jgi:penicillin-binding protein 1A
MTLGGLKEGVTPLDMAHAYQTFATGGQLVTGSLGPEHGPVGIREICRKDGDGCKSKVENDKHVERVLPRGVAEQTNQILSTVISSGTAVRAKINEFAAGKTGTTENYGDAWFVGFTKKMTVAVWVGYPNKLIPMETEYRGEPVAGGTFPAEIWRDFMIAAGKLRDARENAKLLKEGKPPKIDGEDEEPPPGVTTTPAPPANEPDQPAGTVPETGGATNDAGGNNRNEDADGGAEPAQPEPAPEPAPTPAEPAPTEPQPGTGGAQPGGEAAPPATP